MTFLFASLVNFWQKLVLRAYAMLELVHGGEVGWLGSTRPAAAEGETNGDGEWEQRRESQMAVNFLNNKWTDYFSCYSQGRTGDANWPRPLWVLCLASGRHFFALVVVWSTASVTSREGRRPSRGRTPFSGSTLRRQRPALQACARQQ